MVVVQDFAMHGPRRHAATLSRAVVFGCGAVGALLCRELTALVDRLVIVDVRDSASGFSHDHQLRADVRSPTDEVRRTLAQADLVILAVPEEAALDGLAGVTAAMGEGSLLVDTLSVKSRIVSSIRQLDPPLEVLSINPMFAPSLGFRGHTVLAVPVSPGPRSDAFASYLRRWGAKVVFEDSEGHDRAAAALQAVTHAAVISFGDALRRLHVDVSDLTCIAPPPHRTLLALLARVVSGEPDVYLDVQKGNPFAGEARQALSDALGEFCVLAEGGDQEGFHRRIGALTELLGDLRDPLAHDCERMFSALYRADN